MEIFTYNLTEARQQLKNYFLSIYPSCSSEPLDELIEQFTFQKFDKKQLIIKEGETSDAVFFILEGLVRIYYVKEDKEITNWFIKENMLFASTYSILTGNQNYSNYEAIEDSLVLTIKYAVLESFYAKYHQLEYLGRKIVEKYYGTFMKKTYDVLFLSADERYHIFVKEHYDILNRVPLKYIASFLGITQETLSRLRAKY